MNKIAVWVGLACVLSVMPAVYSAETVTRTDIEYQFTVPLRIENLDNIIRFKRDRKNLYVYCSVLPAGDMRKKLKGTGYRAYYDGYAENCGDKCFRGATSVGAEKSALTSVVVKVKVPAAHVKTSDTYACYFLVRGSGGALTKDPGKIGGLIAQDSRLVVTGKVR